MQKYEGKYFAREIVDMDHIQQTYCRCDARFDAQFDERFNLISEFKFNLLLKFM